MLYKQLRYFERVAALGSFTEAAYECGVSQSAISQQLASLEKQLGVQLIERGNRRFSVTPAGQYLAGEASRLLADVQSVCEQAARIGARKGDVLRIAYVKSYTGSELQRAVARFAGTAPKVELQIAADSHEGIYQRLQRGGVDFALSDQRRQFSDEYENVILSEPPVYIELSRAHPLSERNRITIGDVKGMDCVIVAPESERESERRFYADMLGFSGNFRFAGTVQEARVLVTAGQSFFPVEGSWQPQSDQQFLARIPLFRRGHLVKRRFCAFWPKDAGSLAGQFSAILKEEFSTPT